MPPSWLRVARAHANFAAAPPYLRRRYTTVRCRRLQTRACAPLGLHRCRHCLRWSPCPHQAPFRLLASRPAAHLTDVVTAPSATRAPPLAPLFPLNPPPSLSIAKGPHVSMALIPLPLYLTSEPSHSSPLVQPWIHAHGLGLCTVGCTNSLSSLYSFYLIQKLSFSSHPL